MQLTSLSLQGFKSFADLTTLEFVPGVTAIIGPNGSGKSNIIDALRWATGGGRASEYRAGEKTDLIFHGAAAKKSLGFAEVAIEISFPQKTLHISRSILKDGTTKLKLDGKNTRFLDIEEHLSGTGLGRGSLAVIGQGEVGQVLMASPEKLLEYVSEAAGVAKLIQRREQSLHRLERAEEHLQRLDDIMQELTRHIEHLQAEAVQAASFVSLNNEKLKLRFSLSYKRKASLEKDIRNLQETQEALKKDLSGGRHAQEEAQKSWQDARRKVTELEVAYRQALMENEAKRGDLRVANERTDALNNKCQALERELRAAKEELKRLQTLKAPSPPTEDIAELKTLSEQAKKSYEDKHLSLTSAEKAFESMQNELNVLRQERLASEQKRASQLSKQTELQNQLGNLTDRLNGLVIPAEDELATAKQIFIKQERSHLELKTALETKTASIHEAQKRHAEAFAEAQSLGRAASKARHAFEARRGYAQGPKHALNSGLKGVLGSVADLIQVEDKYKQAIANALGRRTEYVVVDSSETAQRVLKHVKSAGGWVTVLPLDLVRTKTLHLSPDIEKAPGVIGLAIDCLKVKTQYRPIIQQLLGSTTLVASLDDAVALAKTHRSRPRLISLHGDIVENYGAMSGGQARSTLTVLGGAQELEEAEQAASQASRDEQVALQQLKTLQAQLKEVKEKFDIGQDDLERLRSQLAKQQNQSAIAHSLEQELQEQIKALEVQLSGLEPVTTQITTALGKEEELLELQKQLQSLRQQANEHKDLSASAQQALGLAEERQLSYKQALLSYQDQIKRLTQVEKRQQALNDLHLSAQKALKDAEALLETAKAALPKDLGDKENALKTAQEDVHRFEEALSHLNEKQAGIAERLEAARLSHARREAALELAQEEYQAFPEGLDVLPQSARSCKDRLNQVEKDLEAIGPVNHRASVDLEAEKERLEDLEVQTVQATLAVTELNSVLEKVDKDISSRLGTAIHEMRDQFTHYVRQLFGDSAKSDIKIEWDENRPKGMHIILQPPGKQTLSLNLLSVGERTMGALAFLFSLMQNESGRGLPLAILDEVDAPLDEANIRRFCKFVEHLSSKGTQFVVITHQKASFDVADALWGITSDHGVSRVFSIKKEEPVPVG